LATKEAKADYDRLFSCLLPQNQLWAGQAPVLMLSVAKLAFEDQSPNRHAFHDVGMAVENLILQALTQDIFVHQMAGFEVEKARELLNLPAGHEPVAMIALGYPGDPTTLPENLRLRELASRTRKPLTEFVHAGRWGQSVSLVMHAPQTQP
jgi:nitroreductase